MSIAGVPPSSPSATISSYICVRYLSILLATCMSIAQGAALSVAPMKPSGVSLLSKWATRVRMLACPVFVHGGSLLNIMLLNGTSLEPVAGVLSVEFCHSVVQLGSSLWKKSTKCCWTLTEPGVPGTRGIRIGASSAPLWMSKSSSLGVGTARRKLSERGE